MGGRYRFDQLLPGESRKLSPIDLAPQHDYLSRLDEREQGHIHVQLKTGDDVLLEKQVPFQVLAYNQWAGTHSMPELLAAFCMPNVIVVDLLLSKASKLLRDHDDNLSLDGYQSRHRERVWKQVSAIYNAVLAEEIQYSNPPASFGTEGQKIRTPERIMATRTGTCLDLALLFAALFEQAGLNSVVLFKEGHAWVGVWLIDTCFANPTVDDVQTIRKRVATGEFMVFEATGIASAQKPSLQWARSKGEEHLQENDTFQYAIDIKRARELQIHALPSHYKPDVTANLAASQTTPAIEAMPNLPTLDPAVLPEIDVPGSDTPSGRIAKWKSKLLDMTLRNRLLNFKPTKSNLAIVCPDLSTFEDALSEGIEFKIRARPKEIENQDKDREQLSQKRTAQSTLDAVALGAMDKKELIADVTETQLEGALLQIYRDAQTGLEEGGANMLYLALGFLEWSETDEAESTHLAPILLIPVQLLRASVRSGFRLKRHDDDALVNPTLLQKLQTTFNLTLPSFDPLPTDQKGIDVNKILQTFRLQVADIKHWEVHERLYLGIFSFTKYLMWKDLQDRLNILNEHPVVAHLINQPGTPIPEGEVDIDRQSLDERYPPQTVYTPLLCDGSQLRAICAASEGKNLVIEGPPGTGKSQTITNLIAHLLASDKSVLFVSEKMVALEVVHRRLNEIGLGPFCLELHSAKAQKSEVIRQLDVALQSADQRTVREWEAEAERLSILRQELNGLVQALHREHPNHLSMFEAMGTVIQHSDWEPAMFSWTDANTHNRTDLEALRGLSREMASLASELKFLNGHGLRTITQTQWSPSWQDNLVQAAAETLQSTRRLQELLTPALKVMGLSVGEMSYQDLSTFDRLADLLLRAPKIPIGLAKHAHEDVTRQQLHTLHTHGVARQQAWDQIKSAYREEIAHQNAEELSLAWRAAELEWWPKKWFSKNSLKNRLRVYRYDSAAINDTDVLPLCEILKKINEEDRQLISLQATAKQLLAEEYLAEKTPWAKLGEYEHWSREYSDTVITLTQYHPETLITVQNHLQKIITEQRPMLRADGVIGKSLMLYREQYRDFLNRLEAVHTLAKTQDTLIEGKHAPGVLSRLLADMQDWQHHANQLMAWCQWRDVRDRAITRGLHPLVTQLELGNIELTNVPEFFEFSYRHWWLKKAMDNEPYLCTFSSANHERKIREFRQYDERFQKLTQAYVVARLMGHVPSSNTLMAGAESEMGRLLRETKKQRGHMPIRQLIQGMPTLLPKLKPCLLMSPLSVAQYLDASHAQFDVVIFDEASQIPVWDAVGAIARGKQLITVGDPKQLPPTRFFSQADNEDDFAGEEIQDMESILDECLAVKMPSIRLAWHYRSQHESLIAFSNVTYYENSLITFPSPVTEDRAVRFQPVQGTYDRGKSRTNRAEADAIVEKVAEHYLNPANRNITLGVVTFNQAQQNLIEKLLDSKRRITPALDEAISREVNEKLLIKNLENVQGDERDIILFSVTYGPDANNNVSLNFGPLNQEGGQRRLNVVVSRARRQVIIYSTLHPERIDLSRVNAPGVRDLKHYLEFAMRGPRALLERTTPLGLEPDSPFEEEVIRFLREKGWEVHPQVGVSGYRIDIGVIDPRATGRYLSGVECDGATYHSATNARERDRLRQHILEGLGWDIYRIWSTEWWRDAQRAKDKLITHLQQRLAIEIENAPDSTVSNLAEEKEAVGYAHFYEPTPQNVQSLPYYKATSITGKRAEDFYDNKYNALLRQQILDVVNQEGPICKDLLFRRISRAWGLTRVGNKIQERLQNFIAHEIQRTQDGQSEFYWPASIQISIWRGFRIDNGDPDNKRNTDEIALQELGNLAEYILKEHGNTTLSELTKQVYKLMGINRVTEAAEKRFMNALSHSSVSSRIAIENELVRVVVST